MKKLAVFFAVAALGIGWFLYPSMRSETGTWRFRIMAKGIELLKRMGKLGEFLGFGPYYNLLRSGPSSCQPDETLKVSAEKIGGVPALLIRPTASGDKRPALVYFHGGGWTVGSPAAYCSLLAEIAKRLQIVVVAFNYRKAPEAPFPAAFDDCLAGLLAFAASAANFGVDASRIAVAGDSAGGNLALAVTAHLHSGAVEGTKFRAVKLGLIYPALQALDFNLPSYHENAWEFVLTRYWMLEFWQFYITGNSESKWVPKMLNNSHASEATRQRAKELLGNFLSEKSLRTPDGPVDEAAVAALAPGTSDPLVSPILFSDEVFRQLPPVYLLSCEYDVLRDEAIVLSNRLKKLGHPLQHYHSMHYHSVLSSFQCYEPEGMKVLDDFISFLEKL